MRTDWRVWLESIAAALGVAAGAVGCGQVDDAAAPAARMAPDNASLQGHDVDGHSAEATTLYVWASDQAHIAPDFLAVIDFDRRSKDSGRVLRSVPIPPPGNIGHGPHHCHTSADHDILACGGLLSVLKG